MRSIVIYSLGFFGLLLSETQLNTQAIGVVAEGATVERIATGFLFVEGPTTDAEGNLYFSDLPSERIYRWTPDGEVSTIHEDTGRASGLHFDLDGNLLVCEMGNRRVTAIDADGKVSVLADEFRGKRFNSPDDLWVDSKGGVYFSDPRYGPDTDKEMDGDHVYYISPDRQNVRRVADDLVRANGVVGTSDGNSLYVADHGAGRTYLYTPASDGTLTDKRLFVAQGADGMTLDERGNVYLTGRDIMVYDPSGTLIASIAVPEPPANLTFGGLNGTTLFIAARTSIYALEMTVTGQHSRP